jgi:hypothetical protein
MHLNDLDLSADFAAERPEPAAPTTGALPPPPADSLGVDAVALRLAGFLAQLTTLGGERAQAEREARERRLQLTRAGSQERERLEATAAETPDPLSTLPQRLTRFGEQQQRLLAAITDAAQRRRVKLRNDCERACAKLDSAPIDLSNDPGHRQMLARSGELAQQLESFLAELNALRQRYTALDEGFTTACHRARIISGLSPTLGPNPTRPLRERIHVATTELEAAEAALDAAQRSSAHQDTALAGQLANHGMLIFGHALAAGLAYFVLPVAVPWLLGSGLVTQLLVPLHTRGQRQRLARRLGEIRPVLAAVGGTLQQLERAGRGELDPQGPMQPRVERLVRIEQERKVEAERLKSVAEKQVMHIRRREQTARERLQARATSGEQVIRREAERVSAAMAQRHLAESQTVEERCAAALAAHEAQAQERRAKLTAAWADICSALTGFAAEATARIAARHPAWTAAGWETWTPPATFAPDLLLGEARLAAADLAAASGWPAAEVTADLTLPIALAFPSPASLLVRCGPDGRAAGLQLLHQVLLRALVSFPAGKLRLVLIDPMGLGEAFAPFLDLAEHDESLLGDGVLNEPVAIERGLDDLVAHLETVIQKRLRGRYATIEDYNREAGELQEPLHLVAVADFPTGFSERALERLALLARTGARCGVHVLLLHDDRRTLPAALDLAWFRRTGVILRALQGRLVLDREGLQDWAFTAAAAANPATTTRLISAVGAAADGAQRVELAFSSVAPSADEVWSKSSAKSLQIPLGRRGPDRLQFLELGRGTAQHVLIGGRTGSGKSTLLHVLIASAALWYAPSEIEFHLIDFKKGVEFKAYASLRLPHARVVAIESDREFGLSVLRQLDRELTSRGEAFRAVGAQDLAAHRAAGGAHLPRILLVIDEFQEFFTEDDAIARDAALLLDRFVRQGRAFGVHVVLGSQTLAGAYSLAKSSLGQIGVRIALPCNEADAHLLLHEDNDATRLLTRPGDAVYNDQAGLAAGNSPFQVCWLSDEQEAGQLKPLAARASAAGWKPAQPPVFFEGSAPSDLTEAPASTAADIWVGQSSSLTGAAVVPLPESAGGNLLIVGQNREAAAATCAALVLGLAGATRTTAPARIVALDGEEATGPFAALTTSLAPLVTRHGGKEAATLLADLAGLLARRQSDEEPDRRPVLLLVFALQRLRALRPDDDLGFGGDSGKKPSDLLAELLANGPEYGIHVVVWCDALASVQRGLGRRALREFDARILFQMAAADSSELIDDDGASRLGLHTALLAVESDGRREKFRPCSLPTPETVAALAQARLPA